MDFAEVGNLAHAVSSASVLTYTVLAVLFARPGAGVFDEEWVANGFCVANQDKPYWTSHDLCLYADTVLVLVCALVYRALRGAPGMKAADQLMWYNLLGHQGHGIAHGFIAWHFRRRAGEKLDFSTPIEKFATYDWLEILAFLVVGLLFWMGLLKGAMPSWSGAAIAVTASVVQVGGLFVRDVLGFAYVNAVLTVAFSSSQLSLPRKEKDFVYAAFALAAVALSIVPWVEAMGCQKVAINLGGHLIYDLSIPVVLLVSYVLSWRHSTANRAEVKQS